MSSAKSKRLQNVKIIVSESIMVLAVIVTVVVLAFVVSGYWLNSDFKVERQGMLQVSSIPTGASLSIDGEKPSWLSVTNTSKILSSGEHTVELTKSGYDTWSKTVNISEGLLYRLHYPRLFLKERTPELVMSVGDATGATVSPDRSRMVLINNTSEWELIELDSETPKQTKIDISKLFSGIKLEEGSEVGTFSSEIISMDWDSDNSHLLFKVKVPDNSEEWVLLDVNNSERSINITKEFGADFDSIEMLNHSADSLLATRNHNLHKIDLSHKSISSVLVKNVIDFDHLGNEVVFAAQLEDDTLDDEKYYVGIFKIGDTEVKELKRFSAPVRAVISKFYDDIYVTTLLRNDVTVYRKSNNHYKEILAQNLNMEPTKIKVGHDGEFITFSKDNNLATLDMESKTIREWSVDGASFGWLDNDMLYSVNDSNLIVYDYDGLNRRGLSSGVSSRFPVTITDDRWLYYISNASLTREWLIER